MTTIIDIAKATGVGKSTVSRVINGDVSVKTATREKVEKCIGELNYSPNLMARGMRMSKTFSIGIVFPDLSNPFFPEWYKTIDQVMDGFGYMGYICITDPLGSTELKRLEDLASRNIDGIIFSSYVKNPEVFTKLRELSKHMAIVCGDYFAAGESLPYVTYDGRNGTKDAVKYLASQGRKRLAYIKASDVYDTTQFRYQGYQEALEELSLPFSQELVYEGDFQLADGVNAADYFMSLSNPPDAILAATDLMALGCLQRLGELGVNVPGDVALFGFDNISLAKESKPGLSSVNLPIESVAKKTVALLMDQINNENKLSSEILPCELVIRASTEG